ncbi:MAG: hypothetical protein J0L94_04070 [Rhodothermia bacterium]|nr:hypothetical protein [Rhodothermia bacterium]
MYYNKTLVFFWFALFLIAGCREKPEEQQQIKAPQLPDYEVISESQTPVGKAVAIMVAGQYTEETYVALVKKVVAQKKPANLQIYTSKKAYEAVKKPEVNDDYRKGFILVFRQEKETKGEIWWMQEEGPLAALSGTVTTL